MKKTLTIISFVFICLCTGHAQSPSEVRAYIERYKDMALEQERRHGVPATITLAQGIVESAAGTSQLTRRTNNHFGIKHFGGWHGKTVYAFDEEPSWFRVYTSAEASYEDHSRFLVDNPRYNSLFSLATTNYRGWAWGLKKAGYASAPDYARALISYIEAYQLYELNGGIRLPPGKVVRIRRMVTREVEDNIRTSTAEEEEQPADDEVITEEEEQKTEEIMQRIMVSVNDVRCTLLYPGQTLSAIANKYGIDLEKLLDYNDSGSPRNFHEGDIVFLEKKKRRYHGPQDYYRAKEGETLYQVAQQFGIRFFNLARMNDKDIFTTLKKGEQIRLK